MQYIFKNGKQGKVLCFFASLFILWKEYWAWTLIPNVLRFINLCLYEVCLHMFHSYSCSALYIHIIITSIAEAQKNILLHTETEPKKSYIKKYRISW